MTTSKPTQAQIDRRAFIAAGITVVLWASAFVGIRDVADTFSPGSIALGRLAVAVLALGPLLLRQGWQPMSRRNVVLVVASGLLWYALYFVVLNEAERHVDAGTASMLVNTGPIFVGLFAGLFLGESIPRRLLLGLAVAFGGAAVVGIATSSGGAGSGASTLGIVLCLVAAVSYAAGVTLQKPASAHMPALQLTWLACFTAMVATLVFAPQLISEVAVAPLPKIGWLVYLGLAPTALGFTTWAYALSHTPAGRLGVTTYLIPPVVIGLAWLLLGEVPPLLAIVGGAICVLGVVIVRTPTLRLPSPLRAKPREEITPT
ncbi:MAG TPA: DMT family transporter [Candidatus Limnocylindrales bacterium]|nr:DMT family transporter [Candidatus Limnocylindrales bacterium]